MKKFGTILLTVYVTLTTIASVLFGYLYFSTREAGGDALSKADANVLINTVCYDLGWITKDEYDSALGNAGATANALPYEDFNKDVIEEEDFPYSAANYQQFLLMGRELLDVNKNYSKGKYYKSKVTYFEGKFNEFSQVYYASYELKENELLMYFIVITETNDGRWAPGAWTVQITKPENDKWGLAGCYGAAERGLEFEHDLDYEFNDPNVIGCILAKSSYAGIDYAKIATLYPTQNVLNSEITRNMIVGLEIAEVNALAHEKLYVERENFSALLNDEDALAEANYIKEMYKEFPKKSFVGKTLIDSDFAEVMKSLVEN